MKKDIFKCKYCGKDVLSEAIGTKNRNHCVFCLWSFHLDSKESGDRKSECKAGMEPIGLTFKQEGKDKWGKEKQGEIMIIHICEKCGKISINRIAGDDDPEEILKVFEKSKKLDLNLIKKISENNINLLKEENRDSIKKQLFGNI